MVQGEVEEQRLAGDGLEVGGELDQVGLLSDEGGVQTERVHVVAQRLGGSKQNDENTGESRAFKISEVGFCVYIRISDVSPD